MPRSESLAVGANRAPAATLRSTGLIGRSGSAVSGGNVGISSCNG